jgi:Flp pilus assembly protein TadD
MRFPILLLLFLSGTFSTSQTSQAQSRSEKQSPPASRPIPSSTADVKETLDSAHQKLEHGDPQGAIAMLQQLVAAGKSSAPGVQHELGIAYYRSGKLISAEKAFAQAMTEDPNDMESVQMERKINPANAAVYDPLGDLYTRTGQFQKPRSPWPKPFLCPRWKSVLATACRSRAASRHR